jgi:hypothetical protein
LARYQPHSPIINLTSLIPNAQRTAPHINPLRAKEIAQHTKVLNLRANERGANTQEARKGCSDINLKLCVMGLTPRAWEAE